MNNQANNRFKSYFQEKYLKKKTENEKNQGKSNDKISKEGYGQAFMGEVIDDDEDDEEEQ